VISSFFIHGLKLLGAVEPDPSPVDFHAGDAAAGRLACPPSSSSASPLGDDFDFSRRPGDRRALYIGAGPHHPRGRSRALINPALR